WNLCPLLAGFALVRLAAGQPGFARRLAWVLALGALLQAGADVWYRLAPASSPLEWWKPAWRNGAGTFVNRNDFADWVYVATLGAAGWLFRCLAPLHSARLPGNAPADRWPAEGLLLAGALAGGLLLAVASASRGGMLAFVTGSAVFVVLLLHRSRSRARLFLLSLLAVGALAVTLPVADLVLRRLAVTKAELLTHHSKFEIWRQSSALFLKFPLFGTGLGTFATAFNHFKSSGGFSTFTHAENDYLQWLVETGVTGTLALAGLLACGARALTRSLRRDRLLEPELMFAASAALVAFAVHAGVEFVFEIPANALLAAVLLGFCVGCRDQCARPVAPPPAPRWRVALNVAAGIGLFVGAALQGAAAWNWEQALHTRDNSAQVAALRQAVACWPWAAQRRIALVRAELNRIAGDPPALQSAEAKHLLDQLDQALAWDPFNWEVRLERAWLSLRFLPTAPQTRAAVWEAVRLNPLQPQIPLHFAELLARRDPDFALDLLRSADFSSGQYLRDALDLVWQIRRQPERLWELTPNSVPALLALGDFALDKKLYPLAARAFQALRNRVADVVLAEKFLQAQRPDLALTALPQPVSSPRAGLLLARAHFAAGQYAQAIADAQSVWRANPACRNFESLGSGGTSTAVPRASSPPPAAGARAALDWAKLDFQSPPETRDLDRLRRWHEQFPAEPRLTWMLYCTEQALGHEQAAARAALELAAQTAMPE
ncbi:MAG: O-antigen ligase family protein, partial [Verrucomicrobia bacterium]|nr:O-antigen ligase family protein [Verrucomicrobiota bacterium]